MAIETVVCVGMCSPGPADHVVSSTDVWLLLGAACLDGRAISALLRLCYPYPAKGVKATWGGGSHFIAVQVCGKPGEFL